MVINKRFFPEILLENEITYFQHLYGILESVDELASVEITKCPSVYHFRIAPSTPRYTKMLLEEILKFHNMFSIRLSIGKSIKIDGTVCFDIELNN
jgi:hypothetical protein